MYQVVNGARGDWLTLQCIPTSKRSISLSLSVCESSAPDKEFRTRERTKKGEVWENMDVSNWEILVLTSAMYRACGHAISC